MTPAERKQIEKEVAALIVQRDAFSQKSDIELVAMNEAIQQRQIALGTRISKEAAQQREAERAQAAQEVTSGNV